MSHSIERLANGEYSFAFTGARENIWHKHGKQILSDLSPLQILEAASLDWKVEKHPLPLILDGKEIDTGHSALIRDRDHRVLDVVTNDWVPLQNDVAFEFFNKYVEAGNMQMDTAGSLHNGQIVWALAKTTNKFAVFGDDKVECYILFTNPHTYASSISIRTVMTRVVCWNTISTALREQSSRMFKQSHKVEFRAEEAEQALGIIEARMQNYKESAEFLGSKQAKGEDIVEYFTRIFPVYKANKDQETKKEVSKTAKIAQAVIETQPGAEFAKGSWWQIFNAATFTIDHLKGRSDERRFAEAQLGQAAGLKNRALTMALEFAQKA